MKYAAGLLVSASLVFLVSADLSTLCASPESEFTALAECVRTALGNSEVATKLTNALSTSDCTTNVCLLRKLCERGNVVRTTYMTR
ncbi:unnamed protein product [Ixodes hexagonus]